MSRKIRRARQLANRGRSSQAISRNKASTFSEIFYRCSDPFHGGIIVQSPTPCESSGLVSIP
jgi:hypothetical protein